MRRRFTGLLFTSALAAGLLAHFSQAQEQQVDVICSSSFAAPVLKKDNTVGSHRYLPGLSLLKAALPQASALLFLPSSSCCSGFCHSSPLPSPDTVVQNSILSSSRARAPPFV